MPTTSPYRLLTLVQDKDHFFCIPLPQVLGMRFRSALGPPTHVPPPAPSDTIEVRLSAGTLTLRGVGLSDAWTDLVSGKHTAPATSLRSVLAESHIICSDIELLGSSPDKRERD